jgi:hypothetical protein
MRHQNGKLLKVEIFWGERKEWNLNDFEADGEVLFGSRIYILIIVPAAWVSGRIL